MSAPAFYPSDTSGFASGGQAQRQSLGPPSDSPAAAVASQIHQMLEGMPIEQLDRIFSQAEELREEDGAYHGPRDAGEPEWRSSPGGFDLMPLVVGGEEWSRIETGLIQRAKAWNLFLRDIYSGQEILKAGVVPYEIVYADPNFHRGCARLPGVTASYLQLTGFDLQQDSRGQWLVVEDHLGVAEGASYALKKRQIMRQIAPRLFDGMEILPIEDFAAQVLDVMRELARNPDGGVRGVLLAQGSTDDHYLDHASLARQMGVSIVQGSDLVVIDSRLYLKTIAGVEPVDVVLRRLSTSLLDPVTFDPKSRYGVPGLLACVRKGTLAVANGLGSDLANNRGLAAHLSAIIEYYTGEKPLLQSPQVFEMRDLDVREEVADHRDAYVIRHAWKRGPSHEWVGRHMPTHDWNRFWQEIEAAPSEFVAHKVPSQMAHPCRTETGSRLLPATLRAFAVGRDRISPCALAWTRSVSSLSTSVVQTTDQIKDVWILRDTSAPAPAVIVHAQAEEAPKRLRLTSRVAESLFWMGRYAERAEVTTRVLRIVQGQAWPLTDSATARQRQPLWAAMAAITGHPADFFLRPGVVPLSPQMVPSYFLLDQKHPGSVITCLLSCRQNAENIREHFPPEVWSVLNRLYLQVAFHADQSSSEQVRMVLEDRSLHQDVITQLDELTGALEKHMLHNDAWHFWQLGVYAERSLMTLMTLQQVLAPEIGGVSRMAPVSSTSLDLLLQMLAGQYAYRSLYHARPAAALVARLLLQDQEFPRSAFFCLQGMRHALTATLGDRPAKGADAPLRHCSRIITELNFIDMAAYFPRANDAAVAADDDLADMPTPDFSQKLDEIIELILDFNVLISDHYLDHQVVFREPELFDLGLRAMTFNIVHTTAYEYSAPAIESFTELRVRPRQSNRQTVHHHVTEVTPHAALEEFTDYYENTVECLSVPYRHKCLTVTSRSTVETLPHKDALSGLDLSVSEAVRLNWAQRLELFDFLMPSMHAPITPELEKMSKECLPSSGSFSESILGLCSYIYRNFTYMPGVTEVRTPLSEVLQKRQGVCQDFAHLMIALVRCAGLPARYVSGYIETEPAPGMQVLAGATASHAWVEVYLPSGLWVGIDPTNNILEGERHVQIGIGRDYHDVPPLRGVFKGAERQQLSVMVTVSRTTGEMVTG